MSPNVVAALAPTAPCSKSAPMMPRTTPTRTARSPSETTEASGSTASSCAEAGALLWTMDSALLVICVRVVRSLCWLSLDRGAGLVGGRNGERNLGHAGALEQVEHVNDSAVLDLAVGANYGSEIGGLCLGCFG